MSTLRLLQGLTELTLPGRVGTVLGLVSVSCVTLGKALPSGSLFLLAGLCKHFG